MALLVKVIKTPDSPWRKTTFAVFLTSNPLFKWNKATYKQALILLYKVSASWKGSKHQNCSLELATHGNWLLLLFFIIVEVSHWETAKPSMIWRTKLTKRLFQSVELKHTIGSQRILQIVSSYYQDSPPGKTTLASRVACVKSICFYSELSHQAEILQRYDC